MRGGIGRRVQIVHDGAQSGEIAFTEGIVDQLKTLDLVFSHFARALTKTSFPEPEFLPPVA